MLIYAAADLHGHDERFKRIQKNIDAHHPDLLILAGDTTRYFNPSPVVSKVADFKIPVFLVRGNTDKRSIKKVIGRYKNLTLLDFNKKDFNGVNFVGLNGTIPIPFHSQISFTERWTKKIVTTLDINTVLVAHPPPLRVLDTVFGKFHAGCSKLYETVKLCQPRLLICGHIHENPGIETIQQTTVINCSIGKSGAGTLIQFKDNCIQEIEMI